MKITDTVHAKDRREWHAWLKKNHASKREVWLIYYKKHTGKPRISYDDAVEEAICFGWIDSTVKRLDDDMYCQRFTPRSRKSIWSETNINRLGKMLDAGKMTRAGLEIIPEEVIEKARSRGMAVRPPVVAKIKDMRTERLLLRELTDADIPFIYELFSLEETNRHVSNPPVKDMAEAREIYELYCRPRPHLFRLGIVLRSSGKLIGTLGLYSIDMENLRATLGFDLLPEHWGNGYMTEACGALLEHAFLVMGLNRVQASAEPENARSIHVMERLGFVREGIARQLDFYKGAFHDDALYSLLRDEWKSRRGDGPVGWKGMHT